MRNLILFLLIFVISLTPCCITDNSKSYYDFSNTESTGIESSTTPYVTTTTIQPATATQPSAAKAGSESATTTQSPTTTEIQPTTEGSLIQITTTTELQTTTTTIKTTTTTKTTTSTLKTTTTTKTTTSTTVKKTTTTTIQKISTNSDIVISEVQFDAPGDDRKKENLNGEWVEISNSGDSEIDLTGWALSDSDNHIYNFPSSFKIEPGNSVKIHTGSGEDTESDLYWNSGRAIWNNDGDTATLRDKNGNVVDEMSG